MFELSLSKPPTKEASPATARLARHTTEKYSLLFSFCARRISFSLNEKSIFLWCPAFQVFRQVAGLASFLLSKRKAEFPPNPPSAFLLLKRNGNGSRRAKIPSPQPPSFLPACLGFAPQTFGRTDGGTEKKDNIAVKALAPPSRARAFGFLLPFCFTFIIYFGTIRLWEAMKFIYKYTTI